MCRFTLNGSKNVDLQVVTTLETSYNMPHCNTNSDITRSWAWIPKVTSL